MRIYKYGIELTDQFEVSMPEGAKILTVQTQGGEPFIWALVDERRPVEVRYFRLVGTGHQISDKLDLDYIGTFQLNGGSLVFHLFEV